MSGRREVEGDPWAHAVEEMLWRILKKHLRSSLQLLPAELKAFLRHELVPLLHANAVKTKEAYFACLTDLRKPLPDAVNAVDESEYTRKHIELQISHPKLRRLYVGRRQAETIFQFFSKALQ